MAVTFGLQGVLQGGRGVRGAARVDPNVDSELRFFAAWYALAGVLVLRAARGPEAATATVRGVGAALWLAAFGRVLSWRREGRPHRVFVTLLGVELAVPVVLVPWQARLSRPL